MNSVNITNAQENLFQLISDVNTNCIPVTIINQNGENAVLLSENDWNSLMETIYLNSIPGMVESIIAKEPLNEREVYDSSGDW